MGLLISALISTPPSEWPTAPRGGKKEEFHRFLSPVSFFRSRTDHLFLPRPPSLCLHETKILMVSDRNLPEYSTFLPET